MYLGRIFSFLLLHHHSFVSFWFCTGEAAEPAAPAPGTLSPSPRFLAIILPRVYIQKIYFAIRTKKCANVCLIIYPERFLFVFSLCLFLLFLAQKWGRKIASTTAAALYLIGTTTSVLWCDDSGGGRYRSNRILGFTKRKQQQSYEPYGSWIEPPPFWMNDFLRFNFVLIK